MPGQVVDTETAEEFMGEILERVSADDLASIAAALEAKSRLFADQLEPSLLFREPAHLRTVLVHTFATRRKADAILESVGFERLATETDELLRGDGPLPARFERFQSVLVDFPAAAFELPSELLHFTDPDQYWLWARWMWNPRAETGALALVTEEDFDFDGDTAGATYLRVGEATSFVSHTGRAAGFTAFTGGSFGIDVFLASVYAVYMYTVLRLRMTQEFNRIVPQHVDLVRRLLGVHRLEV